MQNLFDIANFPDGEPSELVAGSHWGWTRSDITAAYPTAEYTLKYRINLQSGLFSSWTIAAAKTGAVHVIDQAKAATSGFTAGDYQWQAVLVRDSDSAEVVVDTGMLVISAEFTNGVDTRTFAVKALGAIQATLLGNASNAQQEFTISGKTVISRSYTEMLKLEEVFIKRVNAEKNAIERKAGRPVKSRVLIKMSA
jgi:hypothetical protein